VRGVIRRALVALAMLLGSPGVASAASWEGFHAPGTPSKYDRVSAVKVGPASARNVLVLVPGTQAGAGYMLPFARDLVAARRGWQVWVVERRENLLEDHSRLSGASPQAMFDYYLGWIGQSNPGPHFQPADARFARDWGMRVAVEDLRVVVRAAARGGRRVVLGGHSLGATIAVAYATWDFGGRAGARDLAGLVLIDGGSSSPVSAAAARKQLADLRGGSPFLDLVGLNLPWVTGVLAAVGSTLAVRAPDEPALLDSWPLLPPSLRPPVPVTNRAGFGYAIDASTGPAQLALIQSHIGHLAGAGDPRGWVNTGPATVERAAEALSGDGKVDGTAWYHPRRLSLDAASVAGGVSNPAQKILGVHATHGRDVRIPIYAFETSLGKGRVLKAAGALARRSHTTAKLVDRSATYSHCDPLFAAPDRNDFLKTLLPFLART
jgi:hypothetical protein